MLGRIESRSLGDDPLPEFAGDLVMLVRRNLLGQKGTRIDKERFQGP
jgi:hypothetical protein